MAFRIVGVKTNYSTKESFFVLIFLKGGAHAPVAPPPPGYGLVLIATISLCTDLWPRERKKIYDLAKLG